MSQWIKRGGDVPTKRQMVIWDGTSKPITRQFCTDCGSEMAPKLKGYRFCFQTGEQEFLVIFKCPKRSIWNRIFDDAHGDSMRLPPQEWFR